MGSRLDGVVDWNERARSAKYCATKLASLCAVSRRQLNRYFLKRFGISSKPWLRNQQRTDAIIWLRCGALVKEVSEHLGFSTSSSFARAFLEWFGVSPREYLRIANDETVGISLNVPKCAQMSPKAHSLSSSGALAIGIPLSHQSEHAGPSSTMDTAP